MPSDFEFSSSEDELSAGSEEETEEDLEREVEALVKESKAGGEQTIPGHDSPGLRENTNPKGGPASKTAIPPSKPGPASKLPPKPRPKAAPRVGDVFEIELMPHLDKPAARSQPTSPASSRSASPAPSQSASPAPSRSASPAGSPGPSKSTTSPNPDSQPAAGGSKPASEVAGSPSKVATPRKYKTPTSNPHSSEPETMSQVIKHSREKAVRLSLVASNLIH